MGKYRFDDRVVVVTGAGRGIGRSYAHLFGELGAKVVVNDLGGSIEGEGADVGPAHAVAKEISDAGGIAIADTSDVSTADGGARPVEAAFERFGRVDVVVNNAGNVRYGGLPSVEVDNLDSHLGVHTLGAFNTSRAAWPHMQAQGYGRIVLTGSIGMFGLPDNLGYATAKAALLGMANSMTVSAGETDIKINVILPNAMTRMGGGPSEGMDQLREGRPEAGSDMDPSLVAPMVAYLSHEACEVSGQAFLAGGGRFAHLFVGVTEGYLPGEPRKTTVDEVAENLGKIKDRDGYYIPTSLMDCVAHYMAHR